MTPPPHVVRRVHRRHVIMLVALAAIWGSSFMFIKVAVRELAPADVVFGRVLVGMLALLPAIPFFGGSRQLLAELRRFWWPLTILSVANVMVPFWLLAWSEKRLDSGLAAVLQASMPLFTALLAFGFSRTARVGGSRLVGVVVGFVGVILLVGAQPRGDVLSALAVLLTALCYAASALYAGERLREAPAIVPSIGTLIVATVVTLPFGLAQLPDHTPSWKAIGSIAALGALGLSAAYLLYFELITGAGASYAALVTYLVPALALFYGAVFLGEPVTVAAVTGLALIVVGVALGTGVAWPLRRRASVASSP
jgi:drug/metabolite transporter (DMT)-like permease